MKIEDKEYQQILQICSDHEDFFFVDKMMENRKFRIFNYRTVSYQSWLLSDLTFELRGLTVELDSNDNFLRVASRPPKKFFNLYENPITMDLCLNTSGKKSYKHDGSLISTYQINGKLFLKTKGSLDSEQAVAATKLLERYLDLKEELTRITNQDKTVYCEYCAPDNRIVLEYEIPELIVLGIRCNKTGHELEKNESDILKKYWVNESIINDVSKDIKDINKLTGLEGYVFTMLNTQMRFKIKTDWYLILHKAKDSINNPRLLYEAVLDQATDDLKSTLREDQDVLEKIHIMESHVFKIRRDLFKATSDFYETNKCLNRKDFAILGKATLPKDVFTFVMQRYSGKVVDFDKQLKKNYKQYGIIDTEEGI